MQEKNHPLFREEQQFRETCIWILILPPTIIIWYIFITQVIFGTPVGNNPMSDTMLTLFWVGFGILFPLFFYKLKLTTEVRTDGLYLRFTPFHLKYKKIPIEKDTKYYTRTYQPITEYGGWGIRCGLFGKGKAYNVSGNHGLQIELANGKKLLIGSQKPEQLKSAIDQYLKNQR
ncbi:MAG: DUF6141 family protein [archaeon]